MDIEELETGSGDGVDRVDAWLVALGVALIGIWGTLFTLIVAPSRLAKRLTGGFVLTGQRPTEQRYLGPGFFFVLSILIFVVIMHIVKIQTGSGAELPEVSEAAQSSTSYQIGYGLAQLLDNFQQRVASGNFWSAAVLIVPVYLFSVGLALINHVLIRFIAPRWTASHAVGAALYQMGGVILSLGLVVLLLMAAHGLLPPKLTALLGGLSFLILIGLTAVQTYQFAASVMDDPDYRLGLISAATPMIIIGLIILSTLLAF